jgi:transcriptional regulator with GAF, ATPase, and Fis domain
VPKRLLTLLVDQDEATLEESLGSLVSRALVGVSDQAERSYCAEGAGTTLNDEQRRISHARIGRVLMDLGVRQGVPGLGSAALAKHLYFAVHYGEEELREAAQHSLKSAMEEAVLSHDGAGEARLSEWLIEFAESAQEARFYRLQRGRLFQRLGQFGDAINAFEAVLNEKDSSMGDRDAATLGIAGVHIDRGDFKKAIERASTIKPGRQAYPAALGRKAKALLLTGKNDEALKVCETGLALKPDAGIAADLGSTQALVHYYSGRLDEALAEFESTADLCALSKDLVGQATAVNGVGLIYHRRGDYNLALGAYEESLRLAQQSGNGGRVASAAMNIGTICHLTGRVALATERYRESLRAADLIGDTNGVAKAANNLGNLFIYLNRLPEARYWIERSDREARRADHRLLMAHNKALIGKVLHKEGDFLGARRTVSQAVADLREMGHSAEVGELQIELGMIARSENDTKGMTHFADAVEQLVESSGKKRQLAYVSFLRGEAHRMAGDCEAGIEASKRALQIVERHGLYDLGWMCEAALARCYRENGNAMEAKARFHACTERIFVQAGTLSGRDRETFLKDAERSTVLDEARLAMSEDSVRLSGEVVTGQDQLLRIMEINRRLTSERDLQRLLDFILDSAIALTGAERGFVILKEGGTDEDETQFDVSAARNIDRETLRRQGAKVSKSITRRVLESGEPVMTLDAGEDDRFKEALSVHHMKLRSVLCFPLSNHGDVIGAIYMDNRFQTSTFAEQDVQVISAFADQAAVAITNAKLHEKNQAIQGELKASNERIEKLNLELQKRVDNQALRLQEIEASLALQRTQLQTRYSYENIIGSSPAMQRVFSVLDRVTDTGVPVLVQGESGTGKELVARAIHYNSSRRRRKSFVSVNCAALSETLLESELFGHVRGAFTGADRDRKGLFETAHGGTMFLDEVADMSMAMQAKLLRTVQEGEVWPVGASKAINVDCRIVAACNRDLREMVNTGEFRQDLYFRLNVVCIVLPPLREREEDIIMLVQHFLRSFAEKNQREMATLSAPALELLRNYRWPGNVRELEACVFNACLFCDDDTLTPEHFSHKPELLDASNQSQTKEQGQTGIVYDGLSLAQLEERAIVAALERTEGNKVEAAGQLGITRQTLYNKLKVYGIEVRRNIRRT